MTTLFIADLHLSPERPELTLGFFDYLEYRAKDAETLYILGDLFDYWVGDDAMGEYENGVAARIAAYAATGKRVYFMHGNRDFLIGKRFAHKAGLTLLHDPTRIDLGPDSILLSHGDMLCTDDRKYMRFRAIVRNPLWQRIALMLPIQRRLKIAANMRRKSQASNAKKNADIMDVNQSAVEKLMQQYRVCTLIQGHTHRPDIHEFHLKDETMHRYVVGDWRFDNINGIGIGWDIRLEGKTLSLEQFALDTLAPTKH